MKTQGEIGSQSCKEVRRVIRLSIHMVEANIPIIILMASRRGLEALGATIFFKKSCQFKKL